MFLSFHPPLPKANHSARTANAVYGNTGRGIGNMNHSKIAACYKYSRVYWRFMGADDGMFDRRRESVRRTREQLGKFMAGRRDLFVLGVGRSIAP